MTDTNKQIKEEKDIPQKAKYKKPKASAPKKAKKTRGAKQGIFTPQFPEKYIGDATNIKYRSSWEKNAMFYFDRNINVLKWASEEIKIPYIKPTDKKVHFYIPDFFVSYINANGEVIQEIVEVKPKKEVVQTTKSSAYDLLSIAVNKAKWESAVAFCEKNNLGFRILTEDQLFR
jgi:hypothetical protein